MRDLHERMSGDAKQLHQTMRAVELDKQDLQTAYQEVCAENEKLRDANARLVDDNKHLFGKSSQIEMDLGKSEYTVNELMEREQTLIQEIRNLERNVTFLTQ